MKNYIIFIFLFLSSIILKAQSDIDDGRITALHPAVGLAITIDEKKEFSLLPQYIDSSFESAQLVEYNDSTYSFIIRKIDGTRFEKSIAKAEVKKMYDQIEKTKPASTVVPPVVKQIPLTKEQESLLSDIESRNETYYSTAPFQSSDKEYYHSRKSGVFDLIIALLQIAAGLAK